MSEPTIDLVDNLVAKFPALTPILREHLADNFGEVLPHLFFGDLTRYVVSEFVRSGDPGQVQPVLDELEVTLSAGDDQVGELIVLSFLQNLPLPDEAGGAVQDLLGPRLRSELKQMRSWRPLGGGL